MAWHRKYGRALAEGMVLHGNSVEFTAGEDLIPGAIPVLLGPNSWVNVQRACAATRTNYLMVNRAFWGDPWNVAIGWNGINGWADYLPPFDSTRWLTRGPVNQVQPMIDTSAGNVLLLGQFAAHAPGTLAAWYKSVVNASSAGRVFFRPHPSKPKERVPGTVSVGGDLATVIQTLKPTCVTLNSTVIFECLLAGAPTLAQDAGSVAWAYTKDARVDCSPYRQSIFETLAWAQWSEVEIQDGAFLDHLFRRSPRNAPHPGYDH